MKIFLKILFILIVLTVIVGFAIFLTACSSPKIMGSILMFSSNKFLADVTMNDLVIKNQACNLPRQFTLEDVSLTLKQGKDTYMMSFGEIKISEVMNIFSSGKGTILQIKEGAVRSSAFRLEGLNIELVSESMQKWSGPASAKKVESNGFQVKGINAKVVVTDKDAVISGISGDSYKGKITGNAHVYFVPTPHYEADIAFEGLDTAEMEDINLSFFSQVRGRIYGVIEVIGPAGGIENIDLDMRLGEDGEIQAKMLEPLLPYIPKSTQRENIKAVIKNNGRIRVNNAQMNLADQDSKTISADIRIQSEYLNLDINVTVDVIIEGGIQSLLKNLNQFSFFKKGS
ncbi:MAG: hypothetical protein P9M07_05595 [Candidatus Aceula meridiana]|nr:hypothetical protein [Candidatus Aceula meridiana]